MEKAIARTGVRWREDNWVVLVFARKTGTSGNKQHGKPKVDNVDCCDGSGGERGVEEKEEGGQGKNVIISCPA